MKHLIILFLTNYPEIPLWETSCYFLLDRTCIIVLYHPCNLNPSTYKRVVFGQSGEETVGMEVPVS